MGTEITFEVTGLDELTEKMESIDTVMKISLNEGLRKIGQLFVPAKGTGPLADETPRRSGRLALSTFFTITGAPGAEYQELAIFQPARTETGEFYGGYVRDGTRPHEIRPVRAKALRFEGADGPIVFTMHVHHPGTRPNPYHLRVMDRLAPTVQRIVDEMGARVVAYLAGGGT